MHHFVTSTFRRFAQFVAAVALVATMPHLTATAIAQTEAPNPDFLGVASPEISADGSTIVFADTFRGSGPEKPNRIFVVDADGSNLTEVDSYRPNCGCGAALDISADGSVVLSTD